jgi:succinate-acetate transporter protein
MSWIILGLLIFRWPLLERFVGTIRMFLFDAVIFTVVAAANLSNPGSIPWLGYVLGCLCAYFAISSGSKYLKYSEVQRIENEQGKSDAGPTEGS